MPGRNRFYSLSLHTLTHLIFALLLLPVCSIDFQCPDGLFREGRSSRNQFSIISIFFLTVFSVEKKFYFSIRIKSNHLILSFLLAGDRIGAFFFLYVMPILHNLFTTQMNKLQVFYKLVHWEFHKISYDNIRYMYIYIVF